MRLQHPCWGVSFHLLFMFWTNVSVPYHATSRKKRKTVSGLMRSMHTRSYHGREVAGDSGGAGPGSVFSRSAKSVHVGSVSPNQLSPEANSSFKLKDCFTPTNGYIYSSLKHSFT